MEKLEKFNPEANEILIAFNCMYLRDVAGSNSKEMQFYLNWVMWINPEAAKDEFKKELEDVVNILKTRPRHEWVKIGKELFSKAMAK